MTLFYDKSEIRSGTKLPQDVIDYGYVWKGVEAETGGDLVITPGLSLTHKAMIMSEKLGVIETSKRLGVSVPDVVKMSRAKDSDLDELLYEYLYLGAVIVQRKSGNDLLDSLQGPRLEESLARMNRAVPYRAQRVLLYTGVFSEDDGYVVLDGRKTKLKYMSFVMALTAWCNRGGTAINLASDSLILQWIELLEKQLESYRHTSTKDVYPEVYFPPDMPDENNPFQIPVEVRDWRKTMVTFPGLGPDRVNALKEYLDNDMDGATLWNALQIAVGESAEKIHGWGPKSIENVRNWLGVPERYNLVLQPKGEKNV
jgi:hypothetical protein